jgi:hypothetical protein
MSLSDVDNEGNAALERTATRLLLLTWGLAAAPILIFFFNFRPAADYGWLWRVEGAHPVFAVGALISAAFLTVRDVEFWKKGAAWVAVAFALFSSLGSSSFKGI